jgi:hypothetical protein
MHMNEIAAIAMPMRARPPITPPTIAPTGVDGFGVGVGVGVGVVGADEGEVVGLTLVVAVVLS